VDAVPPADLPEGVSVFRLPDSVGAATRRDSPDSALLMGDGVTARSFGSVPAGIRASARLANLELIAAFIVIIITSVVTELEHP
jgi:hypothetical protein